MHFGLLMIPILRLSLVHRTHTAKFRCKPANGSSAVCPETEFNLTMYRHCSSLNCAKIPSLGPPDQHQYLHIPEEASLKLANGLLKRLP